MLEHHAVYSTGDVICKTDHKPLVRLLSLAMSSWQILWVMNLQEFKLKFEYLPGKLNSDAEYLSRQHTLSPKCILAKHESFLIILMLEHREWRRLSSHTIKNYTFAFPVEVLI